MQAIGSDLAIICVRQSSIPVALKIIGELGGELHLKSDLVDKAVIGAPEPAVELLGLVVQVIPERFEHAFGDNFDQL